MIFIEMLPFIKGKVILMSPWPIGLCIGFSTLCSAIVADNRYYLVRSLSSEVVVVFFTSFERAQ